MVFNNNYLISSYRYLKYLTCWKKELEEQAEEADATYLRRTRKGYAEYKLHECGHTREIAIHHVRNKSFNCHECEETSWEEPSKVYLLKIEVGDFSWLKLGHARYVQRRIWEYGLPKENIVERIVVIDFETGREAHNFENQINQKYDNKRLPKNKMKKYMSVTGATECYPLKMLDKLLEELELV